MRDARNAVVHAYDEGVAMALSAFVRGSAMTELDRLLRALEEGAP